MLGCIVSTILSTRCKATTTRLERRTVGCDMRTGSPKPHAMQARVKFHVLLTSYETALSEATELRRLKWETLVVDEGHRLKNKSSRLFTVSHNRSSNNPSFLPCLKDCVWCTLKTSEKTPRTVLLLYVGHCLSQSI